MSSSTPGWSCRFCTYHNGSEAKKCQMCGSREPKAKQHLAKIDDSFTAEEVVPDAKSGPPQKPRTSSKLLQGLKSGLKVAAETEVSIVQELQAVDNDADGRVKRRRASCSWSCKSCSFENQWLSACCEMCFTARPSASSDSVVHPAKLARPHTDEQPKRKNSGASLKALARFASTIGSFSSKLSPEAREPTDDQENTMKEVAKFLVPKASARGKGRGRGRGWGGDRSGRGKPGRPKMSVVSVVPAVGTVSASTVQSIGKMIRYAFQQDGGEWLWFTGIVRSVWPANSWHKVLFEDGEQMWVRLDSESHDRLWNEIDADSLEEEFERFKQHLQLASPGAFDRMRYDGSRVDGSTKPPRRFQRGRGNGRRGR